MAKSLTQAESLAGLDWAAEAARADRQITENRVNI